ncbi:MAG: serine/threonine protein kinase [Planctomycetes bacterium]|nr:serine/threonine protein kinase [Planctomycetota bacterium]
MTESLHDLPAEPGPDASAAEVEAFLEEVLFHYLLRREEGQSPDVDAYLTRYPGQAERIAALMLGHDGAPLVADDPGTTTRGRRRRWLLDRLGPYQIVLLAASTARGHVYRARRDGATEDVALKVLRRVDRMDPREFERFQREARTVARLGVPGVVPVLDVGEDEGAVYYAMPWIEGATIAEIIRILRGETRAGAFDPAGLDLRARLRLGARVARIFAAVHERGVLHRDIKPSNIMIDAGGEALVLDFGIARNLEDSGLTRTSDPPLGTPLYMAPELLTGLSEEADQASEVFALAATIWELLTLTSLRRADDRARFFADVERDAPDLAALPAGASPRLAALMKRALDREPRRRLRSMEELARGLEALADDDDPVDRTGRRRLIILSLLLLLAAMLVAAWWWSR